MKTNYTVRQKGMKLTHENLQGSWIVVGSEIEHVKAGDEVYHFTPPDRFVMEFKQPNERTYPSKQRYQLTDEGFIFGRDGNLSCSVTAWLESGFLIFRPDHGKETWSTRLTTEEPKNACLIGREEKDAEQFVDDNPS